VSCAVTGMEEYICGHQQYELLVHQLYIRVNASMKLRSTRIVQSRNNEQRNHKTHWPTYQPKRNKRKTYSQD